MIAKVLFGSPVITGGQEASAFMANVLEASTEYSVNETEAAAKPAQK